MRQIKGSLMLLLATFFWGTTFAAQSSAADSLQAFTFNAARSFVGALFLGMLIWLRKTHVKKQFDDKDGINTSTEYRNNGLLPGGAICGVVLFAAMSFQQGGITVYPDGVAASGRAGFLTATYVVMVALCSRFFGKRLHKLIYLAVLICIAGMYFLCMTGGIAGIYFGDVLMLLCAVCFTGHIMVVDYFSKYDSVQLCFVQFITSGVLSAIAMLMFEEPDMDMLLRAAGPILYAGILSSGIAYTLQIEGQKYAEPAIASVIMSLESVFAVLGGLLVMDEHLTGREWIGCGMVFLAVLLAQVPAMLQSREKTKEDRKNKDFGAEMGVAQKVRQKET